MACSPDAAGAEKFDDAAVAAGTKSDTPVMVDFWPRPPERPYDALLLEHMRPGDIHTHVFAQQFPIVGADGKVHVLYNRCPHRGAMVCGDRKGNTGGFFRCSYHAWTFEHDGRLRNIPMMEKGYGATRLKIGRAHV